MSAGGAETAYRIDDGRVIHETIDGEVLVIDTVTGHYHSMSGTGALLWSVLDEPLTVSAMTTATALWSSNESERADEIQEFVDALTQVGLLVVADTARTQLLDALELDGPYAPPAVSSHADLDDLLVFDPIHEVGPAGWPQRSNPG